MKINAWIQMGCERRKVTFDVTDEEIKEVGMDGLEAYIEEGVARLDILQVWLGMVLRHDQERLRAMRRFGLPVLQNHFRNPESPYQADVGDSEVLPSRDCIPATVLSMGSLTQS